MGKQRSSQAGHAFTVSVGLELMKVAISFLYVLAKCVDKIQVTSSVRSQRTTTVILILEYISLCLHGVNVQAKLNLLTTATRLVISTVARHTLLSPLLSPGIS